MARNYSFSLMCMHGARFLFRTILVVIVLVSGFNTANGQDFPEPIHLFRADTLITAVGTAVSSWRDVLNESVSFEQATSLNQPTVSTNAAGFDIVQYSGSNKLLTLNTTVTPQTIVALIKLDQFPSYARVIDRNVGNDSGIHLGAAGFQIRFDDASGKRVVVPPAQTDLRMLSVVTSSPTTDAFSRTFGNITILGPDRNWPTGNYQLGRSSLAFNGDVVELTFFDTELTQTEVLAYENRRYDFYSPPPSLSISDTIFTSDFCTIELDAGDRFESFLWQDESTDQLFMADSPGRYTVEVTDLFGRTLSDSVYVSFPGEYLALLNLCEGETFLYDLMLDEADFDFSWNTFDTGSSINIVDEGTYSVQIDGPNGCSYEPPSLEVSLDLFPSQSIIEVPSPFCVGNNLTVNTASEVTEYLWNTSSTEAFISPTENGTYWVDVFNANGCFAQDTAILAVAGDAPLVSFTSGLSCEKQFTQFTNTTIPPSGTITNEEWIINGAAFNSSAPEVYFEDTGTYEASLTVTLSTGCIGELSGTVDVFPSPIVNLIIPSICEGSEVTFTNQTTIEAPGIIDSYLWDFGNESSSTIQNPSTTYASSGIFNLSLEASSSQGCSASFGKSIPVNSADITSPFFSASCKGLTHLFRSDTLVTVVAENVEAWSNLLDPDFSFIQETLNNQPDLIENELELPSLQFESGTSALTSNQSIVPQTIVALVRIPVFPNYARLLDANAGNDSGIHLNSTGFQARFGDDGSKRVFFGNATTDFQFVSVSSSNDFLDAIGRSNDEGFALGPDRDFIEGNYLIGGTGVGWGGEILELSIFDEELSDQELANYENERKDYYVAPLDLSENDTIHAFDFCGVIIDAGQRFSTYSWGIGSETSQTIVSTAEGWYKVEVTDFFNRTFLDSVYVDYPGTYRESSTLCALETLEYDTELDEEFYDFSWSNEETTPSIDITEEGFYSVTINDTLGCSYTSPNIFIDVDSFPITANIIDIPTFCLGNDLFLSSGFEEAETYLWNTDEVSPFIQPQESGEYWVESINGNGCMGRDTVDITIVGVAPDAAFNFGPPCENNDVLFNDLTTPEGGTVAEWAWTFENTVAGMSTAESPAIFYSSVGTYPVALTVTLDNGCTGTTRDTVLVNPLPLVNFSAPLICSGNEVFFESLTGVPGNGTIALQEWSFGNGTFDTGAIGSTTFEVPGFTTVTHIVTTGSACRDSLLRNIEVLGSPVADFDVTDVCLGQSSVFNENVDVSVSGPVFYNWQFGDGFFSNFPNTSHEYAQAGVYEVTLTATGNNVGVNGCVDQETKTIRVYEPPVGALLTTDACIGAATELVDVSVWEATGGLADEVIARTWTVIDGPTGIQEGFIGMDSVQLFIPEAAGIFEVALELETAAGCSALGTGSFLVQAIPSAVFALELPAINPPFTSIPSNLSEDGINFEWLINGEIVSTEFEPTLTFDSAGDYEVLLVATNDLNCNDTAMAMYTVIVPEYDIALIELQYQTQGSTLVLNAIISNNGNVAVETFDTDIKVGRDIQFTLESEITIPPGALVDYPLGSDIGYLAGRDLPFACMRISNPNGQMETDTTNNYLCIGLNEQLATFATPYPNPAKNEVNLTFVLPEDGPLNVEITSSDGRLIEAFVLDLKEGLNTVDYPLIGWAEGMYFLKFSYRNQEEVFRLVVAR